MTFDSDDAGTGVDATRRGIPLLDQFAAAAPSLALAAGDDVA